MSRPLSTAGFMFYVHVCQQYIGMCICPSVCLFCCFWQINVFITFGTGEDYARLLLVLCL